MPVIAAVAAAITTLFVAIANAIASWWFTPRTMRRIAKDQLVVSEKQVEVAADSATAAATSAAAAARSAEVAAINSHNIGIHEVARLRQEWINTLRKELAELHSALMNWSPPSLSASKEEIAAHKASARETNARLAMVRLLLNPREVASKNVLRVLSRLNSTGPTTALRLWLCGWLVRWSQIVLKTEWDRVRDELKGKPKAAVFRRSNRR